MDDRGPTVPHAWVDALRGSLALFAALARQRPVVDAWSNPSDLDGYTIGGIAGHVLSLMAGFQRRLESGPSEVDAIPYTDWYGAALAPGRHSSLIEVGEGVAAAGPAKVAADLDAAGDALYECLKDARRDFIVPLASVPGAGVRLDDFLRTRFVEIAVHADDIAASADVPCPRFPALAWTLAAGVLSETTGLEGSDAGFVVATSRPSRTSPEDRAGDL